MSELIEEGHLENAIKLLGDLRAKQVEAAKKLDELEIALQLRLLWPKAFESGKSPCYSLVELGEFYSDNPFELRIKSGEEVKTIKFYDIPSVFLDLSAIRRRERQRKKAIKQA